MAARARLIASARGSLEIGHARLRNARVGDRERLAEQLGRVRPADAGLRESSILLIPRLKVARPLVRSGNRDPFIDAVTHSLKRALERARRPWETHGADDPILFEDEADAAAALIEAWQAGSSNRRWWRSVTGGLDPPSWIRRIVLRDAFLLPRVVARLGAKALETWIEQLDPSDIETAVRSIAAAYGLPDACVDEVAAAPMPVSKGVEEVVALVPEARRLRLGSAGRRLVALALLAHRGPALLRAPAAREAILAIATSRNISLRSDKRRPDIGDNTRARSHRPAIETRRAPRPMTPSPRRGPEQQAEEESRADALRRSDAKCAPPVTEAAAAGELPTRFGGLLFLLNALTALGVLGDFTRPGGGLAGLSPFALLDRLALDWLGPSYAKDPLHALFVELAGDASPIERLLPRRWSVPASWLEPWPTRGSVLLRDSGGTKILWHAAGFPVADPGRATRRAAMRTVRPALLARSGRYVRDKHLPHRRQSRWLASLELYLEARLARALGCKSPLALICRLPARLVLDDERLVATFELADHPLSLRLAGLDRDPGWIPAAGRIVEFAFE